VEEIAVQHSPQINTSPKKLARFKRSSLFCHIVGDKEKVFVTLTPDYCPSSTSSTNSEHWAWLQADLKEGKISSKVGPNLSSNHALNWRKFV